jgi:dTDP-4-amino-4,6-dideoxygalactose transaminase
VAALRSLKSGDLPPAGNRIVLQRDSCIPEFTGYAPVWTQSGTSALALAMLIARKSRPEVRRPEVILPAYGCPDLVAAAVYAGVQPVLADVGAGDPSFSVSSVEKSISPRTVALVAVNFLGIGERIDLLRSLLAQCKSQIMLIEDNAQWFPEPLCAPVLRGDLVILSFGRGKPVTLLGGGLLLCSGALAPSSEVIDLPAGGRAGFDLRVRIRAYNALLHPRLYALVKRVPMLRLGQTVYKELDAIRGMDPDRLELLPRNIQSQLPASRAAESLLRSALQGVDGVLDLAAMAAGRAGRLLRYPILLPDQHARDEAYLRLRRGGLGASIMYATPLAQIEGVASRVIVREGVEGAFSFSRRLLTLPTHEGVKSSHIERVRDVLACVLA